MPLRSNRDTSYAVVVQADPLALGVPFEALATLARAVASAAQRPTLSGALDDVAEAARIVSAADAALVRVPVGDALEAVAFAGPAALAAELEGTRMPAAELPAATITDLADAPAGIRHAASRAAARSLLVVPVVTDSGRASLEL